MIGGALIYFGVPSTITAIVIACRGYEPGMRSAFRLWRMGWPVRSAVRMGRRLARTVGR